MPKAHLIPVPALITALMTSVIYAQEKLPEPVLPVQKVVLFSSGVGYFEHFGNVRGEGITELRFDQKQLNDVLKSLVLQDLDGGMVSTLQYPSSNPLEKTLSSFQVDLSSNPSLASLLQQLRGTQLSLELVGEKYQGTILGVEERKVHEKKESEPITVWYVNLLDGSSIRQIELDRVTRFELKDPELQNELTKALQAIARSRNQDKKTVTIRFSGQGERRVRLGYVVESPVWKTSYRLVLTDDSNLLQGWAIVENQTDNDWNNVQLSLVSGQPISFVMNLYQPLYVTRPEVKLELYESLRPQTYEGGLSIDATNELASRKSLERGFFEKQPNRPAAAMAPGAADALISTPLDPTASIRSLASGARVGELFEYTVGNVSLPRQQSAMIPIVSDKIEVEKVSIYNASVLPNNPLNGAAITNKTDKHLLQGPITVFDAGSYAGDAKIDNLPPGEKRLLSYGIDLQTIVQTRIEQQSEIVAGKIVKGVLDLTHKSRQKTTYDLQNKSDRDKTLIIEHPITPDWQLVQSPEPVEKTQSLYRFKIQTPQQTKKSLDITEEKVHRQTVAVLPADIDLLIRYTRTGTLPESVRKALSDVITRKQTIADLQRQIDQRNQQIERITREQSRIRENMRTVDSNSQYYNRLLTKLNEQETQLETIQTETDQIKTRVDKAQEELERLVSSLTLE